MEDQPRSQFSAARTQGKAVLPPRQVQCEELEAALGPGQ